MMTEPPLVSSTTLVELMVVPPKSMPPFAPARFSSRLSMPASSMLSRPSVFSISKGPLTRSSPRRVSPFWKLSTTPLMSVGVTSTSSAVPSVAKSASAPSAWVTSRCVLPLIAPGFKSAVRARV